MALRITNLRSSTHCCPELYALYGSAYLRTFLGVDIQEIQVTLARDYFSRALGFDHFYTASRKIDKNKKGIPFRNPLVKNYLQMLLI
jgi:hypothetical protein